MADEASLAVADSSQDRHTPARPPRLTLRTRLTLSVALSVAAVVGVLTFAGMRLAQDQLDADLRETARLTAVALADDIELRDEPVTRESLLPLLRDFMDAADDLYAIAVYRDDRGNAVPVVTTSEVAPMPTALVRQVMASGEPAWSQPNSGIVVFAAPVRQGDLLTGAVAVAVSLRTINQLRRAASVISVGGAIFAIAGITLLINLLARNLILAPLNEIRDVIGRARRGDLSARAAVHQQDEFQEVADGLNAMLMELDELHRSLNQRVTAATDELRQRNEQLVRSYESVLQLREAAARAQQLATIGQTAANVAHQIGTPLNLVSGHVQLLQHELTDPALQRRLDIVQEQVERVASVVRDLLARARPHGERQVVSVSAILDRLAEAMRARLAASGVSLQTELTAVASDVVADETQFELALLNLITNALDAMPEGGVLRLTAGPHAAGVRIVVSDTGPGVAADVLPRIFDPWVTTKASGRGSGLGLSITRDVITGLGGTINVASTPGHGATFTIELPTAEPETAAS